MEVKLCKRCLTTQGQGWLEDHDLCLTCYQEDRYKGGALSIKRFIQNGLGIHEAKVQATGTEIVIEMEVPMAQVLPTLNSLGTLDKVIGDTMDMDVLDTKISIQYHQETLEAYAVITVKSELD
jgi:hypothetical protein